MKTFSSFLFFLSILTCIQAQTTLIPDENFEQSLLNQGIDTDQTLNGQVATVDIEELTSLDVVGKNISDLTGIEDFVSLTFLNASYNENLSIIDLSQNTQLQTLILGEGNNSEFSNSIETLDLSNNIQLTELHISEMFLLTYINLKNNHNDLLTDVNISCEIETANCGPICIEVDDIDAANNNQAPYNTWNASEINYTTEAECNLGVGEVSKNKLVLYPNPTNSSLFLPNYELITEVVFYNVHGKKVENILKPSEKIEISHLTSGTYFIKIFYKNKTRVTKLIKN